MSIERLFNHSVRVYRLPDVIEARGTLGSTSKVPEPVTSATTRKNARPDQSADLSGALVNLGPGEQLGSKRRWFLSRDLDVRERDVLSVTSGPESGLKLSIESVVKPTNPQIVHHIEVIASVWKGTLG